LGIAVNKLRWKSKRRTTAWGRGLLEKVPVPDRDGVQIRLMIVNVNVNKVIKTEVRNEDT
jgi:hypothetical protein